MFDLTNTTLDPENGILTFTLHTTYKLSESPLKPQIVLYIDEAYNYNNIYKENEELHSYSIHLMDTDTEITFGTALTVYNGYDVPVTVTAPVLKDMNLSMKHIWMFSKDDSDNAKIESTGIFYDANFVYQGEMSKLRSFCSTCLDDQQIQRIMLITFKKQLFDLAIVSDDLVNTLKFYSELMRLLDVSICKTSCETSQCNKCCSNGVCSIC